MWGWGGLVPAVPHPGGGGGAPGPPTPHPPDPALRRSEVGFNTAPLARLSHTSLHTLHMLDPAPHAPARHPARSHRTPYTNESHRTHYGVNEAPKDNPHPCQRPPIPERFTIVQNYVECLPVGGAVHGRRARDGPARMRRAACTRARATVRCAAFRRIRRAHAPARPPRAPVRAIRAPSRAARL